jgi:hypothetical protein
MHSEVALASGVFELSRKPGSQEKEIWKAGRQELALWGEKLRRVSKRERRSRE